MPATKKTTVEIRIEKKQAKRIIAKWIKDTFQMSELDEEKVRVMYAGVYGEQEFDGFGVIMEVEEKKGE